MTTVVSSTTVPVSAFSSTSCPSTITPALPHAPDTTQAILQKRGYPRGSFSNIPAYTLLRDCAHGCLDGDTGGFYGIWDFGNCANDQCVCRLDVQPIVVQGLSSCISTNCGASPTADYVGATSVYASFCSSVTGIQSNLVPTAAPGTPSSGGLPSATTIFATQTVITSSSSAMYSECHSPVLYTVSRFHFHPLEHW
jgi:hypothetical protein